MKENSFWVWLKTVFSRLGELIVKLISVKVVVAVVLTYVYLRSEYQGVAGFIAVAVVWLAVVSLRYAEKVAGLLPASGIALYEAKKTGTTPTSLSSRESKAGEP